MTTHFHVRSGSVQGTQHAKDNMNNQDAARIQSFQVAKHDKTYHVGVISDGCSGLPAFTRSEVGSNLLATFCMARIQQLITSAVDIIEIPAVLYQLAYDYVQNIARITMPAGIHWPYPVQFKPGRHEFRNHLDANQRFVIDYLAATVAGFIDDGERLVVFRADDGVVIIDGTVFAVDQHNEPEYLALNPSGKFETLVFDSAEVQQLAIATDGLKELLESEVPDLPDTLFSHFPANPMGLQYKLNILRKEYADKMRDDCTVITRERLEVTS